MRDILTLTRRHGRSILLLTLIATALGVSLNFARTAAADAPIVEPDVVLAAKVSAAIAAQPDLANLNLTVDVVNRAAEIGGPVPDESAVPKIEAAARKVPGLLSVRVTGWVASPEDPLRKLVEKELKGPPPLVTPPAAKPAIPSLVLVPKSETVPTPVTAQRMPAGGHGLLLDPVGPGGAPVNTLPMPAPAASYPTIPPPAVPVVPAGVLTSTSTSDAEIEKARVADVRFTRLTVELRNGTATISGSAVRSTDAWDFAAALRKLPGIERVVVGSIK